MKEEQLYSQLLEKYRTNRMSESEFQRFIELMQEDGSVRDRNLDVSARKDWMASKILLEQIKKEKNHLQHRFLLRKWALSSAAAIALLCVAWFMWPTQVSDNLVYQTGYGETDNIELPDGSKVLLNANSSLIWKGDWKKTHQRQVVLQGEAYFDVTKVKGVPFDVEASDVLVHVLGTEFNVRNRGSEAEVFLHEGKVDLQIGLNKVEKVNMKPGDFVRYDKTAHKVSVNENEQMDKKAAWVDGMLTFENKKVTLILKEFQDLYGKEFKIENPELAEKRMDLSLPYADWELVRKALEIAIGAEFVEANGGITVK